MNDLNGANNIQDNKTALQATLGRLDNTIKRYGIQTRQKETKGMKYKN